MNEDIFTIPRELPEPEEDATVIIVRLTRSYWHDANGAYQRTTLKYLKRKCRGFNIFEDDCFQVGCDAALPRIKNLHKCKDGVYQLIMKSKGADWETGYVEDWDYELIPDFTT